MQIQILSGGGEKAKLPWANLVIKAPDAGF